MSVCSICGSLDFVENFQEESRQLSSLSEDIAVLYRENSLLINNLKNLSLELENFEDQSKFYEDTTEDDVGTRVEEVWELLSQEKDAWHCREDSLREQLGQQLQTLSQDLSTLHHQHHHHQHSHLPRHLWGHQSLQWYPPSLASSTRARRMKQQRPERLLRWLQRRMPKNLIDLNC